jgi:hypothetical protein
MTGLIKKDERKDFATPKEWIQARSQGGLIPPPIELQSTECK